MEYERIVKEIDKSSELKAFGWVMKDEDLRFRMCPRIYENLIFKM